MSFAKHPGGAPAAGLFTPVLGLLNPVVRAANTTGSQVERGLADKLLVLVVENIFCAIQ